MHLKNKIGLALGGLVLALLISEVLLQLFSLPPTPARLRNDSLPVLPTAVGGSLSLERRPRLIQSNRKQGLQYNISRAGFRGSAPYSFSELTALPDPKILILGGSFVFDVFQSDPNSWPEQLEAALRKSVKPSKWMVLNGGIPSLNLPHVPGRLLYEGSLLRPKVVIISSLWNDIRFMRATGPLLDLRSPPVQKNLFIDPAGPLDQFLTESSAAYAWLRFLFLKGKYRGRNLEHMFGFYEKNSHPSSPGEAPSEIALAQYRGLWMQTIRMIRTLGALPVVLIEPVYHLKETPENKPLRSRDFRDAFTPKGIIRIVQAEYQIQREMAAEGAVVLDYTDIFAGNNALLEDHVHLSAEGSQKLARLISKDLRRYLK